MPRLEQKAKIPEVPGLKPPSAADRVRAQLAAHPDGVKRQELIAATGLDAGNVDNGIMTLIRAGKAERIGYGLIRARGEKQAEGERPTPPAPPVADARNGEDLEFCVFSHGVIQFIDASRKVVLTLSPKTTSALRTFFAGR